jgi:hypothetical protein
MIFKITGKKQRLGELQWQFLANHSIFSRGGTLWLERDGYSGC